MQAHVWKACATLRWPALTRLCPQCVVCCQSYPACAHRPMLSWSSNSSCRSKLLVLACSCPPKSQVCTEQLPLYHACAASLHVNCVNAFMTCQFCIAMPASVVISPLWAVAPAAVCTKRVTQVFVQLDKPALRHAPCTTNLPLRLLYRRGYVK